MAKRNSLALKKDNVKKQLIDIIDNFFEFDASSDIRKKVLALIPAIDYLRKLGKQIIPSGTLSSARERILSYMLRYPSTIIDSKELLVVSGITDYQRRIRELRVQFGWKLLSGKTAKILSENEEWDNTLIDLSSAKPDQYILIDIIQDREAAFRWNQLNEIRRQSLSVQDKILHFLRKNVGQQVTGEEIAYLANGRSEWARRIRELRTEEGWPVKTKVSGRPDLPVGVYVLEEDKQAEIHDRHIPDSIRVQVLTRDDYKCQKCNWKIVDRNPGDPRHLLELHHLDYHLHGGENSPENLVTICNVHHDEIHRLKMNRGQVLKWLQLPG